METLTDAINRLAADGWEQQLEVADRQIKCVTCGLAADPLEVTVDRVVRFEGPSDPADAAALYAITLPCGCRGTLVTGFGYDVSGDVAATLRALRSDERFG